MKIYTYGYQGKAPEELKALAERLDAYVADIRFMPFSKDGRWSQDALKASLGWRYQWVKALGNKNYKGKSIQIENMAKGFEKLGGLLATGRAVILLCMCKNLEVCHRKVVSDEITREGLATVEHLGVSVALPPAPGLFEGE